MAKRKRGRFGAELRCDVEPHLARLVGLCCAITGEPVGPFVRRAVWRLVDRTLSRHPGACLWLRPRARVFETVGEPGPDGLAVVRPLAEAAGGERVWVLQRLEGLPAACDPEGREHGVGFLCDLSPGEQGHAGLSVRRVVVSAEDVLPHHPGRAGGAARRAKVLADLSGHAPILGVRHEG